MGWFNRAGTRMGEGRQNGIVKIGCDVVTGKRSEMRGVARASWAMLRNKDGGGQVKQNSEDGVRWGDWREGDERGGKGKLGNAELHGTTKKAYIYKYRTPVCWRLESISHIPWAGGM